MVEMSMFHHRHSSQKDKRDELLMRKARQEKHSLVADIPMPLIDLGIDTISDIISEHTNGDDDAFQEAWLQVLERSVGDPTEITHIAQSCFNQVLKSNNSARYKTKSMDAPLSSEPNAGTLHDILPSPSPLTDEEIDNEINSQKPYLASSTGKDNTNGHVTLDYETVKALRKLYPHDPINHIIRRIAGLPPAKREKRGWHKWEDAIVRERYPWGGSRAVSLDVYRTRNAIEKRAQYLGVCPGRNLPYKPVPEWLTKQEVMGICNVGYQTVDRWIGLGYLQIIRIAGYYHGHDGIFITPSDFKIFIKDNACLFDNNTLAEEYKEYLPDKQEWASIKDASKALGIPQSRLQAHIRNGNIESRVGWLSHRGRQHYIKIAEAKRWLKQPYPVISKGREGASHYLFRQDDYGNSYLACCPHKPERYLWVIRDSLQFPTCKRCLQILGKWRKDNIPPPSPDEIYKGACLICRNPVCDNGTFCPAHKKEMEAFKLRCITCGRTKPPNELFCELCKPSPRVINIYSPNPRAVSILRNLRNKRYHRRTIMAKVEKAINLLE